MLSYSDTILFPDECEVLEVSSTRHVFPIFKNGSSSIVGKQYRRLSLFEIANLPVIEVFVRNPFDRYVSGVQTFLQMHPDLDRTTMLSFIGDHLFLNRHFSLQFHWLVNLRRYTKAKIYIRPMAELNSVTDLTDNISLRDQALVEYFSNHPKLNFYLQLDKVLTEKLIGNTVTFNQILKVCKVFYPDVYEEVINRSKILCNVLD